MQIVVIAGFVVAMSLMGTPAVSAAAVPWWAVMLGVVGYVALTYAAARGSTSIGLRRLMRASGNGGTLGPWPAAMAVATQVYLVAALGGLMLAGWARLINETLHLGGVPLLPKVVALTPFVAALLVYWWATYPLERAFRDRNRQATALAGGPILPVWTRGQFLWFNIRCNLLFVAVPVGLIILVVDVVILLEPVSPTVAFVVGLIAAGGIFVSAPAVIVRIWRTRPLPAGPLRDRLDQLRRRAGFACRDILVWDTGGVVVNAAVMGVVRPVRYVLLSDAMLEHLDDEAVAAIFAHEAGHVAGRHIPYMILFMVGLVLLCGAAVALLGEAVNLSATAAQLLMLLVIAVLWAGLFGMLSRRFEHQADVFAASTAPIGQADQAELTGEGVSLFSTALLAVARLNGIAPSHRNFRHGSIEHRLKRLDRLLHAGGGRARVDRSIRRIKFAIWTLLAAGAGIATAAGL